MNIINATAIFSLVMSGLNWLLFLTLTLAVDKKQIKELIETFKLAPAAGGAGNTQAHAAVDPSKLATATGNLAGAFKKAGAAPTAAALSVLFLFAALIAEGITKV